MKKVFCYLGILLIICLVLFPPVLRIVLPEKKKEETKVVIETYLLYCANEEFIVINTYDGDKIKLINLKKLNQADNYKYETGNELLKIFNGVKNKGDTLYNVFEDGELITIDFSVSSHPKLEIDNLTGSLEIQKEYYESQNLTCEVRK
ncbi:MAG: hypothetical protein IKN63_02720 [Bacilli bacterium]|nr:hypothetical protein [Bacilli bacterium]